MGNFLGLLVFTYMVLLIMLIIIGGFLGWIYLTMNYFGFLLGFALAPVPFALIYVTVEFIIDTFNKFTE